MTNLHKYPHALLITVQMKFQNFVQQILSSKRSNTLVNELMLQRQVSSNFCICHVGLASYFLFFCSLLVPGSGRQDRQYYRGNIQKASNAEEDWRPTFTLVFASFSLFGNILFPKPVQLITFLS